MSNSTGAHLQRGVIVEFDFAVLAGHDFLMDICRKRLDQEGIKFDAGMAARFMGGKSFSSGLNALCNKLQKTLDVPAVIADCNEQFAESVKGALGRTAPGFIDFVNALVSKNLKVVVLTRSDGEAVKALFSNLPPEKVVVLHDAANSFGYCSWDGWRRAARKCDLHERLCVAVAGSGFSVKGALNAGMGVIVKDNAVTEYQDVSGCDVRIADFTAKLTDEVVRILRV